MTEQQRMAAIGKLNAMVDALVKDGDRESLMLAGSLKALVACLWGGFEMMWRISTLILAFADKEIAKMDRKVERFKAKNSEAA